MQMVSRVKIKCTLRVADLLEQTLNCMLIAVQLKMILAVSCGNLCFYITVTHQLSGFYFFALYEIQLIYVGLK